MSVITAPENTWRWFGFLISLIMCVLVHTDEWAWMQTNPQV